MKILLAVLALSNLVHAGTEIPGSTKYTCINDADEANIDRTATYHDCQQIQ